MAADPIVRVLDLPVAVPQGLWSRPELLLAALRDVVDLARNELIRIAGSELQGTGQDYVEGVQPPAFYLDGSRMPQPGETVASLELLGWLPNAIENGWPGGDMKVFLLKGRNAKTDAKGRRYNTVPFRHGTPGTTGRHFVPMGATHERAMIFSQGGGYELRGTLDQVGARMLGEKVHEAAKKLAATTGHPEGGTQWGERLPAGMAEKLRTHHKTDVFAGMVRVEHTYRAAVQNQYKTFRRVSEASDPRAWVHPGIEPRRFFPRVSDVIAREAGEAFKFALGGQG